MHDTIQSKSEQSDKLLPLLSWKMHYEVQCLPWNALVIYIHFYTLCQSLCNIFHFQSQWLVCCCMFLAGLHIMSFCVTHSPAATDSTFLNDTNLTLEAQRVEWKCIVELLQTLICTGKYWKISARETKKEREGPDSPGNQAS